MSQKKSGILVPTRGLSRRSFLRTGGAAAAGALAMASGLTFLSPRALRAQDIAGTDLRILWLEPSIPASKEARENAMRAWAEAAGVNLTLETVALDQLASTLATMAELNSGADLVEMYAMDVAVNAPVLSDLTSLSDELSEQVGGWYEGPQSVVVRDGQWKALPMAVFGQYWIYRTDLFEQVGAEAWPETWEGLHEVGTKLKAAGAPVGFALGPAVTDGATHCYSLLWSYGGREFDENGEIALDSPETRDCLEFFQAFYNDACAENAFAWNETGNNGAFLSGQISVTNNANTIYAGIPANAPDLVGKVSHGNTLAGPAGAYQYMSMDFWAIPNYSQNPAAAAAFLRDSFYTPEFQTAWTQAGNGYNLPAFGMLEEADDAWPTDPNLASARHLAATSRVPGWPGPFTQEIGESMNRFLIINMFAAVAQGTSPQDAINMTVDEMNNILQSE